MKRYPKVPRHDLEFVPEELFSSDDLVLLEKIDGMNCRFMMYDERYRDMYQDVVLEEEPDDGDIIFGTKNVVRGIVSEDINNFDDDLHDAIQRLREINKSEIYTIHTECMGPAVWFAEYSYPHTVEYNDTIPTLIGFDIYCPSLDYREPDEIEKNPYKERFVGFLTYDVAFEYFEMIGLDVSPVIKTFLDEDSIFNPDEFDIPISQFGDLQAEGVVIRSDMLEYRSKYVSKHFKELNKSVMGMNPSEAESPEEWFVASFVATPRVRKKVQKAISEGYDFSLDEEFVIEITERTLQDIWIEEFTEITNIEEPFNPRETHDIARERVYHILERMKQVSARTGKPPEKTLSIASDSSSEVERDFDIDMYSEINLSETEDEVKDLLEESNSVESALIKCFVPSKKITGFIDEILSNSKREPGGWVIPILSDRIKDEFWTSNESRSALWRLDIEFTPSKIDEEIMRITREEVDLYGIDFGD